MDFKIEAERREQSAVVRIMGEVDLFSAPELRSTLDEVIGSGVRHIVVDLSTVDFLDSSGLGALVGALKHLRSLGHGTIVLAAPPPAVRKILELTGINQVFEILPTVDEALGAG